MFVKLADLCQALKLIGRLTVVLHMQISDVHDQLMESHLWSQQDIFR